MKEGGVVSAFYRIFGQSFKKLKQKIFWEHEKDIGKTTVDSWRIDPKPMKFFMLPIFFLSLRLWAQPLPSGTYHNLKPTTPMVLDTGTYIFVHLHMKNQGDGIWMDARNATKLTLTDCSFDGTGKGTALLTSGNLVVNHCHFRNMEQGIRAEAEGGKTVTVQITRNTFTDLGASISLSKSFLQFKEPPPQGGFENTIPKENGRISNCQFELPFDRRNFYNFTGGFPGGDLPEVTGILSQSDVTVESCRFQNQTGFPIHNPPIEQSLGRIGIESQVRGGLPDPTRVHFRGNVFQDMTTAIRLGKIYGEETEPAIFDFVLKCNQFKLSCAEVPNVSITDPDPCAAAGTPARKGLVIGEEVRVNTQDVTGVFPDQIGGNSAFDPTNSLVANPNANEWPLLAGIDRSTLLPGTDNIQDLPWKMPANWISIDNSINNPEITYFRYFNEFLIDQTIQETGTYNFLSFAVGASVRMTASTGNNPGELACQEFNIDNFDVFPLRVAVLTDSANILTSSENLITTCPWLGDAFPNPSEGVARIKAFIPSGEPIAVLQVVDLGTGKILSGKVLEERGELELILDCTKASAGTYGYQVLIGKKQLGMKKLTILK